VSTASNTARRQIIYKGKDVDLRRLPIPIFSSTDEGRYITFGITVSKDPDTDRKNTSIYRMQLKGPNRLGIMVQQLHRQLLGAETKGKGLPVAIAIGTDPVIPLATQWQAPYGTDDVDLYDIEKVMWAVATRCRPEDDVIVFPRLVGSQLDPSAKRIGRGSGLGIDATRPVGEPFPQVVEIPGVENVSFEE
jgi:2,5-furandicarboxylate decarboxylase 1